MFIKRTLTGICLAILLVGVILASHYVSAIFVDILILLFTAGAVFELHSCFKGTGRKMFIAPSVIVLTLSYPTFYLMQHFLGGEDSTKSNIGFLGLFIVLLLGMVAVLIEFTFRPSKDVDASELTEEALKDITSQIVEAIHTVLEKTPPELAADIADRGIVLTGGGSLLRGLEELIYSKTGINTMTAEEPMTAVAIGTGKYVEFLSGYRDE